MGKSIVSKAAFRNSPQVLLNQRLSLFDARRKTSNEVTSSNQSDLFRIREEIFALQQQPSPDEAWFFLQCLLGCLPSRSLLRGFRRRLGTLGTDEVMSWLLGALSRTPAFAPSTARYVVSNTVYLTNGAREVRGDEDLTGFTWARWHDEWPILLNSDESDVCLLISAPSLLVVADLNLSVAQCEAVLAVSDLVESELWLDADALSESQFLMWPQTPGDAYGRFMQWRTIFGATGVFSRGSTDFQRLRTIRKLYAPQGSQPLKEMRETPKVQLANPS